MKELHVDSVIKEFGGRQLLTDIFVSCRQGEIIGLLGRNGSGKSTLLKIIFGSLKAESKFVRINGKLNGSLFSNRNRISYLPQDSCLPAHTKINRLVSLMCAKDNITKVMAHPFVNPYLDKKPKELSGGEKRLIEILLFIHSPADYILIDEPFNGVAPIHKEEVKKLIQELSSTKGFIITDHDYEGILDIATKTVLLHDGGTRNIAHRDELSLYGYLAG